MGAYPVLTGPVMRYAHTYLRTEETKVDETLAQEIKDLLAILGSRYVAYYPALASVTGSPKAALMLGHAMYMTRVVMEKQPVRAGWFWKTSAEWKQATGLTVRELETARRTLVTAGVLSEERRGMPAKLWFRVNLDELAKGLCEMANTAYRPWSWDDRVLKTLLGKPVMFYAPLAWIADSALAGLYASLLVRKLRQALGRGEVDKGGWFSSPVFDGLNNLQYGRRMLTNSRAKLVDSGMVDEIRENRMQSTLLTRLNLTEMLTSLRRKICPQANEFHSLQDPTNLFAGSYKQELPKTRNKSCPNRESRVAGSANQELPEARNKSFSFRETSSAVSATFSYKEINTPYLPPHKRVEGEMVAFQGKEKPDCSSNPATLIFPEGLLPQEKQAAITILAGSHDPQLLLDELAGQMVDGHVTKALGYLRALRQKQLSGAFQPECAYKVAAARQRKAELLKQREGLSQAPDNRTPPDEARRHVAALRQRLWGKT